tara:strand:- start:2477 stop:3226 length:750 start_codon:yes stop_codon:yes gene_type:complete
MKLNFLAIIPARGGSKEIKNKNLIKINNKPLVSYSIEAAKNSKYVNKVVVSTDNKKIMSISKKFGAEIVVRPRHLTTDKASIEDAVMHTLKKLKDENYDPDYIILLQPTSPLRKKNEIDEVINKLLKTKADSIFTSVSLHPAMWKWKEKYTKPIFNKQFNNPVHVIDRQKLPETLIANGSIYVTKKEIFKKSRSRVGGKVTSYIMDPLTLIEIDSKRDLETLKVILNQSTIKKLNLVNPKNVKKKNLSQ